MTQSNADRLTLPPDGDDAPSTLLLCQECGYNLRGVVGKRCPECGHDLANLRSDQPLIPWVRRREIGAFRAYWSTVFWVSFKYKTFCEEVVRDVDYRDAQRFRWITVGLMYLGVLVGTLGWYVLNWPRLFRDQQVNDAFKAIWPMAIIHVLIALYLIAATGAPSYFFDRLDVGVRRRNSAIAMSYYTLGALAWTPVNVLIIVALATLADRHWAAGAIVMMAAAMILVSVADWNYNLERTMRRVMPHKPGRASIASFAIPALWLVFAVLFLGLLPLVAVYAYVLMCAF